MSNLPSADDMVKMLKMLITFAMCTTQLKSKRECWSCIWCCLISSNPWYPSLQEVVALRNTENKFFRSFAELSEWHMGNYLSQNSEWNHFTESYCCNKWMHATDFAEPSIALSSDLDVGCQSNYQPQPKTYPSTLDIDFTLNLNSTRFLTYMRFVATGGRGNFSWCRIILRKPRKFT